MTNFVVLMIMDIIELHIDFGVLLKAIDLHLMSCTFLYRKNLVRLNRISFRWNIIPLNSLEMSGEKN